MYTWRRLTPVALVAAAALLMAACSSGNDSSSGSAGSAGSGANVAAAAAAVTAAKAVPTFMAPGPPIDISSLKGKKVFDIPSVPNPFVQGISSAIESVAKQAGVTYTKFDAQGQVSQWIQGMSQAISSKQDLIILTGAPDPRALQPQLAAAKAANIPVVVDHFYDNSAPTPPACDGCTNVAATVSAPFYEAGKAAADWITQDSGGKANVLLVGGSDVVPSPGTIDTMNKEFAAVCPGCKTQTVNIPAAGWNSQTQGVVQSALQANPNINYVYVLYDAMVAGAVPAVQTLGKTGKVKITSYNGSPYALDYIRSSEGKLVAMDVGEDSVAIGYATADQAFRILLGKPAVPERTPYRIIDKTNVSEFGNPAEVGKGYGNAYISGYSKLWGLS